MTLDLIPALIGGAYLTGLIVLTLREVHMNRQPGVLPQTLGVNSTANWAVDRLMLDGHTRVVATRLVLSKASRH